MASRPSKRPGKRASTKLCARTSWHHLATSPKELVTLWEESHAQDPLEKRAAQLLHTLAESQTISSVEGNEAIREFVALHEQGAQLATYALAMARMTGTFLPVDQKSGEALLRTLCERGFPPAFAQLLGDLYRDVYRDMLADEPNLRMPCSEQMLNLITLGSALGVEVCLILHGQAWLKGWVRPDKTEARKLALSLLDAARGGCWEALHTLLEICIRIPPGYLEEQFVAPSLQLLEKAARVGWTEAMYFLGADSVNARLLPRDFECAKKWLYKAWRDGHPGAGAMYSEVLVAQRSPKKLMDEARQILETCCSRGHPRAMVSMSDYIMHVEGGYTRESEDFMRMGVKLGLAEPYVSYLWHYLMRDLRETPGRKSRYLKDLTSPLLAKALCARHKAALYALMTAKNRAARDRAMAELEDCARHWYGPAAASLAEIHLFGLFGQNTDPQKAQPWHDQAMAQHEPRAIALQLVQAEARSKSLSVSKRERFSDDVSFEVDWASTNFDNLASALACSLILNLTDAQLAERDKRLPDRLLQTQHDFIQLMREASTEAIVKADVATLVFLARQFTEAYRLGLHDRVVGQCFQSLADPGEACAAAAHVCITFLETYGEPQAASLLQTLQDIQKARRAR